jgi:hypothetical protein
MLPAHQRLDSDHLTGGQRQLGLEVHIDLPGVQRLPELGDELESASQQLPHAGQVAADGLVRAARAT